MFESKYEIYFIWKLVSAFFFGILVLMQIHNFIDLLTMTWWWQISIFYFLFSIKCSPFSISTFEWVIDTVFILVFPIFNRLFNSSPPLTVFQLLEKHSVSMRSQFWLPKQHFFSPALSSFEFGLSWALFFLPSFFFTKLIILSKVCNTTFNERFTDLEGTLNIVLYLLLIARWIMN